MKNNYKMGIYYLGKKVYEVDVVAYDLDQAREFAYEMFEMNSNAEKIED